jgi:hypothetical protein
MSTERRWGCCPYLVSVARQSPHESVVFPEGIKVAKAGTVQCIGARLRNGWGAEDNGHRAVVVAARWVESAGV